MAALLQFFLCFTMQLLFAQVLRPPSRCSHDEAMRYREISYVSADAFINGRLSLRTSCHLIGTPRQASVKDWRSHHTRQLWSEAVIAEQIAKDTRNLNETSTLLFCKPSQRESKLRQSGSVVGLNGFGGYLAVDATRFSPAMSRVNLADVYLFRGRLRNCERAALHSSRPLQASIGDLTD